VDDREFTADSEDDEHEANHFAATTLIPEDDFETLLSLPYSRPSVVKNFAAEIGIDAGIVVGRLHHEELVPHGKLVSLRTQYAVRSETE
jgi:Zn-dependent peptidase ImmA (M78 family)